MASAKPPRGSRVSNVVKVALGQVGLEPRPAGSLTRPLSIGTDAVRTAAEAGAEFVVLPELWPSGPFELPETIASAQPFDGQFVSAMAAQAAASNVWLHAGSFLELAGDGRIFNTSVLFDDRGEVAATYRKRHLFGFDEGEAALIDAGDDIVVVDTPLGPTGLATCYDLRFPEHFRLLLDAGAEVVALCSGWPVRRIHHWDILVQARAVENQLWMLACNTAGVSGEVPQGGHSVVVDPWGRCEWAADEPTVLVADVDPGMAARTRGEFPVLRDRR